MGKKMPGAKINLEGVSVFPKWYTVVTKYNYEQKLANTILEGAEKAGVGEYIIEVMAPIKTTVEVKYNAKGKKTERVKHEKIYPLYVFVKAIMNDEVWNYIKNIEGSSAILAPSGFPVTIEEEDINTIKIQCGLIEPEHEDTFEPEVGQDVYIMAGALQGQYGKIARVDKNGILVTVGNIQVKIDAELLELVQFVD
jgi:transcriptional antiterminator NusG